MLMFITCKLCYLLLISTLILVSCSDAQDTLGPGVDPGEAAAGSYGEISVTYSSTPYIGTSYGSYAGSNGSSFNAYPKESSANSQTTSASATQPAATAPISGAEAYVFPEPPDSEKDALLNYNVLTGAPSLVYYHQIMMDWRTFVSSFPKNAPMLWINTQGGWQWYSTCPLGGWLQEVIFIHEKGNLRMYESYPDQTVVYYDFGIAAPGYHYLWFNGDTPGRRSQLITVNDMPSNALVLDVF
jgi:hypothetical protein